MQCNDNNSHFYATHKIIYSETIRRHTFNYNSHTTPTFLKTITSTQR